MKNEYKPRVSSYDTREKQIDINVQHDDNVQFAQNDLYC